MVEDKDNALSVLDEAKLSEVGKSYLQFFMPDISPQYIALDSKQQKMLDKLTD